MKTERAIELLHRLQDEQFDGQHGDERREALEMAVRALEGDGDMISRQAVMKEFSDFVRKSNNSDFAQRPTWNDAVSLVGSMPSAQPEILACGNGELVKGSDGLVNDLVKDCISRQQAIDALDKHIDTFDAIDTNYLCGLRTAMSILKEMPSAQPEQRYTEEELRVFKHGISLSLLSKRSSQHWQYDEDTATEIKFLERLYEKVSADMRGAE